MKIVKFKTHKHSFEFVCEHRNTRSGFAHDAALFIDGYKEEEATCHYLNRTWERWGYQSVCLECIWKLIKWREEVIKERYKVNNGISRVTAKRKKELEDIIKKDDYIKMLLVAKKILNDRLF